MGIVIAFRTRPRSSDDEALAAPAVSGAKRGELIVFPGTDFTHVLPALSRPHRKARTSRKTQSRKTE